MRIGALLAGASEKKLDILTTYGKTIGYAFQIADDMLDVKGTLQELGKTPGKDKKSKKNTYVSFYGYEKSKEKLKNFCTSARKVLLDNNIESSLLLGIADNIEKKVLK